MFSHGLVSMTKYVGAGEMAQRLKVLIAKPDDLSCIPKTDGERRILTSQVVL